MNNFIDLNNNYILMNQMIQIFMIKNVSKISNIEFTFYYYYYFCCIFLKDNKHNFLFEHFNFYEKYI